MKFGSSINYKHLLLFLLSVSLFALIMAYIGQYGFDLQPCILCLYQRIPFFAIVVITSLFISISKLKQYYKPVIMFCIMLLIANAILALYHTGVEQKIFSGPMHCSESLDQATTLEELKELLAKTKAVRCDEPAFIFLKISMAGWNVIYCLLSAIIATIALRLINNKQNEPV